MPTQVINWPAASNDALAVLQEVEANESFILNELVDGRCEMQGLERKVTLTSAFDISGANITISGFDINQTPISEVLVGPNADTVTSVNNYNIVTSAIPDIDIDGTSIGWGLTGKTQWVMGNELKKYFGQYYVGVEVLDDNIEATVSFAITPFFQITNQAQFEPLVPMSYPITELTDVTASAVKYIEGPIYGFQLVVTDSDADGTLRFAVTKQGT